VLDGRPVHRLHRLPRGADRRGAGQQIPQHQRRAVCRPRAGHAGAV
jgi:hypothetical protein